MKYTIEQLEAMSEKLQEMPKKQEYSNQEAIKFLSKVIVATQNKGYSTEQIAEILCSAGMNISIPAFKACLRKASVDGATEGAVDKPKRKRKEKITASQDAATSQTKTSFTPRPDSDDI